MRSRSTTHAGGSRLAGVAVAPLSGGERAVHNEPPRRTVMSVELDHVLVAVSDLAESARELEARYGLASIEGGCHPGWGTANRIVPLGDAYLELVTVVDEEEAQASVFGGWVAQALPAAARPLGWAVRTRRLDDVVERLELEVSSGSRVMRDGSLLRWRLAGIDCAAEEPTLPFFIEWADGTALPGSAPVAHPAGRASIATLRLAGDADRLADWLGPNDLPVTVRAGPPGITTVTLAGAAGEITLDPR